MREREGGRSGALHPPKQARSRRSYHRILEAAADLLAERPFDAITVDEIAARAGYTKGAFYARFESKATLLRHLVARLTDGALEAWDDFLDPAAWEGAAVAEIVEAFVRRMAVVYRRRGHVMRVIDREVRLGGDAEVRATIARVNDRVARRFTRLMETRRGQLPASVRHDVERACRFWLMALEAVLRSGLLRPDTELDGHSPEAVTEGSVALLVPYLAGPR